jgi:hypothetical protein
MKRRTFCETAMHHPLPDGLSAWLIASVATRVKGVKKRWPLNWGTASQLRYIRCRRHSEAQLLAKLIDQATTDGFGFDCFFQQPAYGRHRPVFNSARDYVVVVGQVGVHVYGEAVEGNTTANFDTDSRNLSAIGPNTGASLFCVRSDAEIGQSGDDSSLQGPNIL